MTAPILKVENVHAAYSKKEILRGLSFEVYPGEVVMLLGENGAGKSTALKVIAGLLRPTQGRIEFNGRDITRCDVQERQRLGIGCLLQGGRVFPNLTVQDNFKLALSYGRRNSKPAPQLGEIFSVLRDRRNDRAGLLSGGQRQMLALEMMAVQQPRIALLDEPSAALSEEHAPALSSMFAEATNDDRALVIVEQQPDAIKASQLRQLNLTTLQPATNHTTNQAL